MSDRPYSLHRLRRRRGAVLAVALWLLGFQLVGGNLHAAGSAHDPAGDCQVCMALDRLDPVVTALPPATASPGRDRPIAAPVLPTIAAVHARPYAIRAPPSARRS